MATFKNLWSAGWLIYCINLVCIENWVDPLVYVFVVHRDDACYSVDWTEYVGVSDILAWILSWHVPMAKWSRISNRMRLCNRNKILAVFCNARLMEFWVRGYYCLFHVTSASNWTFPFKLKKMKSKNEKVPTASRKHRQCPLCFYFVCLGSLLSLTKLGLVALCAALELESSGLQAESYLFWDFCLDSDYMRLQLGIEKSSMLPFYKLCTSLVLKWMFFF